MDHEETSCCRNKPGLDRRSFLKRTMAAGSIGVIGVSGRPAGAIPDIAAWNATLLEKGERRQYRGSELQHIAFPLGGVGAGQVFLTGRGRLDIWQIVNNFNGSARCGGAHFAVWARAAGGAPVARLLQQGSEGDVPGFDQVVFSGEYPLAWVDFSDESAFPLRAVLEAYSPMIPLNTHDSALPAAVFNVTVSNPTQSPVEASVLATAPNLAGWDGYSAMDGVRNAELGGNQNTVIRGGGYTGIHMHALPGTQHRLSAPCWLSVNDHATAFALRLCGGVRIEWASQVAKGLPSEAAVWYQEEGAAFPADELAKALDAVKEGAALILSGAAIASLAATPKSGAQETSRVVFEDWESGSYEGWSIEGDAFGDAPSTGTGPGQNIVSGFRGSRLVNTWPGTDMATGKAVSRAFTVEHDYIHLLVGGGNHKGQTCINLMVDGAAAHTAAGDNSERLRPVRWDVAGLRGKTAQFEIVDANSGGWGHVLVDDITFSDSPVPPFADAKALARLHAALPFTCAGASPVTAPRGVAQRNRLHKALNPASLALGRYMTFSKLRLRRGARVLLEDDAGTPLVVKVKHGKGHVVLCNGTPSSWAGGNAGKLLLGSILAQARGAEYEPQTGLDPKSPHHGDMVLLAAGEDAASCSQWDDLGSLWRDFAAHGRVAGEEGARSAPGRTWNGALSVPVQLGPGESRTIRFVLVWHFPNRIRTYHYGWGPGLYGHDHHLGNHYATVFPGARGVGEYVAANLERLERDTRLFHDALYDSSLPHYFLEALSANIALTRSPIYIWTEEGAVGGFEGSDACCPMNCTHVYNYAMSMAYIFPSLERKIREMDLLHQMHPEKHFIPHRTVLPLSQPRLGDAIGGPHQHALDGELGTILKTYREWRHCGDRDWLDTVWPNLQKVMRHVMRDHDVDADGVFKGLQANTYDIHLYGSNTFLGTLYLAALRATEEMARIVGEPEFAAECRARFDLGRAGYDQRCWNGEYYYNVYDAPDATPETYNQANCYGPGCFSDQLLGQWWAHVLGLGYLLPKERVRGALKAIQKYNWRADLSDHQHTQRVFAEGSEKGLLTCTWPRGGRPGNPILYCDEVWTGLEYHVAASLLYEGFVEEALQIVRGARERYTGNQRNPWSEIECGGHYARAMSSYSLLHAAAGLVYDAGAQSLVMSPVLTPERFRAFFTAAGAWGNIETGVQNRATYAVVDVKYGELKLQRLTFPNGGRIASSSRVAVSTGAAFKIEAGTGATTVIFRETQSIAPGQPLTVRHLA